MRKDFFNIICCIILISLAGCEAKNAMPDLRETYFYKDTKPFGGYTAYHILEKSYPDHNVQIKTGTFYNTAAWISDTASLYVNISKKYFVSEEDATALMDYVYKGNTAFIAAGEIDSTLLDKLYCKEEFVNENLLFFNPLYTTTGSGLVPAVRSISDSEHQYFYWPMANYFSEINDRYCRVAGYNKLNQPNFIVFFWGKGRLYLHCDPRAFSNYFLLNKNNYQYMFQPLKVMPEDPEHIFWDDHYNKVNYRKSNSNTSTLGILFSYPPLKWAFLILLFLLLIYIIFNGKRRQRIIPVIKPVQNSSIAFAEAISGVYLKDKDNKMITDKMISYFNDSIRNKYFLNTSVINNDFLNSLSRKAGVPLDKTEKLYKTMEQLGALNNVNDVQLLDLNSQIQQFNKYKS